jgi:hypothetical protein
MIMAGLLAVGTWLVLVPTFYFKEPYFNNAADRNSLSRKSVHGAGSELHPNDLSEREENPSQIQVMIAQVS